MAGFFSPNFEKEGRGIGKNDIQKPGYTRFFQVLKSRFWQIILLNALYIFACLPIITIGPATAALNYVLRNFSQSKHVYPFGDFIDKCKEHFFQGVIVFLTETIIGAGVIFSGMMWSDASLPVPSWLRPLALFFFFIIAYALICTNFYIYPMMVSFDLPLKKLIKNSLILGMYKLGRNIIMILFSLLIFGGSLAIWPLSFPFVFFLDFSIVTLFNNFWVFPLLKKHIATPEDPDDNLEEPIFKDTH